MQQVESIKNIPFPPISFHSNKLLWPKYSGITSFFIITDLQILQFLTNHLHYSISIYLCCSSEEFVTISLWFFIYCPTHNFYFNYYNSSTNVLLFFLYSIFYRCCHVCSPILSFSYIICNVSIILYILLQPISSTLLMSYLCCLQLCSLLPTTKNARLRTCTSVYFYLQRSALAHCASI
jgi:hypothetical protein